MPIDEAKKSSQASFAEKLADYAGGSVEDAEWVIDDYIEKGKDPYGMVIDDPNGFDKLVADVKRVPELMAQASFNVKRDVFLRRLAERWKVSMDDVNAALGDYTNVRNEVDKAVKAGLDPFKWEDRYDEAMTLRGQAWQYRKARTG